MTTITTNYNYTRTNLKYMPYAQASVRIYDNGDIVFQSYSTDVIIYNAQDKTLTCTGTYSQTTRKQIGKFLREYFPNFSYYDMKSAYENDYEICIVDLCKISLLTGEIL